ncbi:hypothetical protein CDAR_251371 [Caerostris darwini]|uniref:Uncharacterized protein n=1 Tax=Caerostris darwini TaxID=1538125 RepID=A0AAV4R9L6_9ARAC|nr:hypothetical protein CDAR_251371 [Caerostris darwini]
MTSNDPERPREERPKRKTIALPVGGIFPFVVESLIKSTQRIGQILTSPHLAGCTESWHVVKEKVVLNIVDGNLICSFFAWPSVIYLKDRTN